MTSLENREPISILPVPAERIRLRQRFGITQEELAQALGVTRKSVRTWERGTAEPTGAHRRKYANILNRLQLREGGSQEDALTEPYSN